MPKESETFYGHINSFVPPYDYVQDSKDALGTRTLGQYRRSYRLYTSMYVITFACNQSKLF